MSVSICARREALRLFAEDLVHLVCKAGRARHFRNDDTHEGVAVFLELQGEVGAAKLVEGFARGILRIVDATIIAPRLARTPSPPP